MTVDPYAAPQHEERTRAVHVLAHLLRGLVPTYFVARTALLVAPVVAYDTVLIAVRAALIASLVTFLLWVYLSARRLRKRMTTGPVMCVVWFLVPLVNIFKPYDVLNQLVRATNPTGPRHPRSVLLFWTSVNLMWMMAPTKVMPLVLLLGVPVTVGLYWVVAEVDPRRARAKKRRRSHHAQGLLKTTRQRR